MGLLIWYVPKGTLVERNPEQRGGTRPWRCHDCQAGKYPRRLNRDGTLLGHEVDFFLDVFLGPAAARQDSAAILDHFWMTAEISGGCLRRQLPEIRIFADEIVHAADLSGPVAILPGPADGGNVLEPRDFVGHMFELLGISKLPRAAGAFQKEKTVPCREFILLGVAHQSADIAHEGRDPCDGAKQQMIPAPIAIEREAALGYLAQRDLVAHLKIVQRRRQL